MATIPYASEIAAMARSEAWATHLGCGQQPEDVTRYWFPAVGATLVVGAAGTGLSRLIREDQMTAEEIAALVELYPAYAVGVAYAAGDLVVHEGQLYEVIQAHTSQADWIPAKTPALYLRRTPEGVIPEWVQPAGAHDAYPLGAQVLHKRPSGNPNTLVVWESTVANNVWEPGVFGWVEVP